MDNQNDKIAILLHTTFTRFELAKKTIESFRDNPDFVLHVADTGPVNNYKLDYYRGLEQQGHIVAMFGWDISPAITRNYLIDGIKEKYVFKIDDDFMFDDSINYRGMIDLLESNKDLGLVGMGVKSTEIQSEFIFDLKKTPLTIIQTPVKDKVRKKHNDLEYFFCDVTPDCWIAKRSIFPQCEYDERYHVGEGLHTDFFVHIKYNTPYNVAYCPECVMYTFKHDKEWKQSIQQKRNSFYHKKRFRFFPSKEKLLKKWNIKDINKY